MQRIIQLDPLIANQIAAGEVIERPASVIKELIENSLDANASQIEVEIENGGMQLIRVRDNGIGIVKEDLILAFLRHATSKITTVADLTAINSLGFRGEALASIACVAQCRLISKPKQQETAWQVQIAADLSAKVCPAAHPYGTTIEVKELFYNTPARRKFLRSEKTELQAIEEMLRRLALSHPQVSFRLKHQQRQIRYYPTASHEGARIAQVCGQAFIQQARQVTLQATGLGLKGWVGSPTLGRRQADCQYFFINGRMIKDRLLNHAIKTIYQQQQSLIEGTYPCYVLYLTIDPHEVDVNVHPTKQEVRFAQARLVHDFMLKAIQQALSAEQAHSPTINLPKKPSQNKGALETHKRTTSPAKIAAVDKLAFNPSIKRPSMQRYLLFEQTEGVVIVDLKKIYLTILPFYFQHYHQNIPAKALLFPLRVACSPAQKNYQTLLQFLAKLGFQVQQEKAALVFLNVPIILHTTNIEKMFITLVQASIEDPEKIWSHVGKVLSFECLHNLSESCLLALVQDWLNEAPRAPCVRLSHEQLAQLMSEALIMG